MTALYDELMCEGAVLADYDRRRLLVFGGEDIQGDKPLQQAYIEMLRCVWEGWRVDWAAGGLAEVAAEAGVAVRFYEREQVRLLEYARSWGLDWAADRLAQLAAETGVEIRPDHSGHRDSGGHGSGGHDGAMPHLRRWEPATRGYVPGADGTGAWQEVPDLWHRPIDEDRLYFNRSETRLTVVTTREPGGVVDRPLGTRTTDVLVLGPRLAEILDEHPPIDPTPALHSAEGGAYIDWRRRELHYWLGPEEPSCLPGLLRAAWPGWTVRRNDGALTGQFVLSGRDPALVRIDPATLRRYLVRTIFSGHDLQHLDSLIAELAERARQPGVVLAPGALRAPRPDVDAGTRQRLLASVLARLNG